MLDKYSRQIEKHFLNPRNQGIIKNSDGEALINESQCGDVMKVYIKIGKRPISENSKSEKYIKNIKVENLSGCFAIVAAASVMTEIVKGKSLKEVLKLIDKNIIDELGGLPLSKMHCASMVVKGIEMAINNYREK